MSAASSPEPNTLIVLDAVPRNIGDLPTPAAAYTVLVPVATDPERTRFAEAGYTLGEASAMADEAGSGESRRATDEIISALWRTIIDGMPLSEAMVYHRIHLAPVMHAYLATGILDALGRVDIIETWIEMVRPERIILPRVDGPWSTVARCVAAAEGIPLERLKRIPRRVPLLPPTRRAFTQYFPRFLARWRDGRAALRHKETYRTQRNGAAMRTHQDVLAVAHFSSDIRTMGPIIERLRQRNVRSAALTVDAQGAALKACRDAGLAHFLLQAAGGWEESERRVSKALKALGDTWRAFLARPAARELHYHGVSVMELMREQWETFAEATLEHNSLRQFLWWTEMIARGLEEWSPKLLMIGDEAMPFRGLALEAARLQDIPVLCVLHGAMPDHPKHQAARSTKVAVAGDLTRRQLIAKGTGADRVVVTGLPQFDPLADTDALERVDVAGMLGLPTDKPVIVYTMLSGTGVTPMDDVLTATVEVLEAVRSLGDRYTFVFKRHPADRGDLLRNRMGLDPAEAGFVETLDAPIHPLLWKADLVITQMSTTGQEALLLNKPLIVVNLSGKPDSIPFVEYGAALGVYRRNALAQAIESALEDPGTRETLAEGREGFVSDFAHRIDGRATDRVVGLIDDMLRG